MKPLITVRKYKPDDAQALAEIYYNTIHLVNSKDYTKEQVDVWAPATSLDGERWAKKFARTNPYIAMVGNDVAGFAEFEPDGHIDCFYCHHNSMGQGVGSALMNEIMKEARESNIPRIFAEVSITAKPFFEKQGFVTICEQTIIRDNVKLKNYKMEKHI